MSNFDPEFLDLTFDAALKTYWHRKPFRAFLSTCKISNSFLASWSTEETKRDFLHRVFEALKKNENGAVIFQKMALYLSERKEFPDLANLEDSKKRIADAKEAINALKKYLDRISEKKREERETIEARRRASEHRQFVASREKSLKALEERLGELALHLGQQQAGYDFQGWFYDLVDFFEIHCRRPYISEGRQIDGSITVDGTTYLVELKFTKEQASAPDIDSVFQKVETKADNTMGIVISISGFSSVAIRGASKAKTVLLLLDHSHLYMALQGVLNLKNIIERVRRHASQTGKAYLHAGDFGK